MSEDTSQGDKKKYFRKIGYKRFLGSVACSLSLPFFWREKKNYYSKNRLAQIMEKKPFFASVALIFYTQPLLLHGRKAEIPQVETSKGETNILFFGKGGVIRKKKSR